MSIFLKLCFIAGKQNNNQQRSPKLQQITFINTDKCQKLKYNFYYVTSLCEDFYFMRFFVHEIW